MSKFVKDSNGVVSDYIAIGASQAVAFTNVSSAESAAVGGNTTVVRIASDEDVHFVVGPTTQTATLNDAFLPANTPEYIGIDPGDVIAVIAPAGGAAGSFNIVEAA